MYHFKLETNMKNSNPCQSESPQEQNSFHTEHLPNLTDIRMDAISTNTKVEIKITITMG